MWYSQIINKVIINRTHIESCETVDAKVATIINYVEAVFEKLGDDYSDVCCFVISALNEYLYKKEVNIAYLNDDPDAERIGKLIEYIIAVVEKGMYVRPDDL